MYTYYQTNLTVTYSDGSDSDMAVNPYPIVRTPTVMPRDLAALYSIPDGAAATNKSLSQGTEPLQSPTRPCTSFCVFFLLLHAANVHTHTHACVAQLLASSSSSTTRPPTWPCSSRMPVW